MIKKIFIISLIGISIISPCLATDKVSLSLDLYEVKNLVPAAEYTNNNAVFSYDNAVFPYDNEKFSSDIERSSCGDRILSETYWKLHMKDFLKNLPTNKANSGFIVFDIGGGRGHNSMPFLLQGFTVVVNDKDKIGLLDAAHGAPKEYIDHLWINEAEFPANCDFPEQSLDVVIFSHVAHYLSGDQIVSGLIKILSWLKPGGRLYMAALTPWSQPYFFVQETEQIRFDNNELFPGECNDLTEVLSCSRAVALAKSDPNSVIPENSSRKHHPFNEHMPNFGNPLRVSTIISTIKKLDNDERFNILCANYFGAEEENEYCFDNTLTPIFDAEERLDLGLNITEPKLFSNYFTSKIIRNRNLMALQNQLRFKKREWLKSMLANNIQLQELDYQLSRSHYLISSIVIILERKQC